MEAGAPVGIVSQPATSAAANITNDATFAASTMRADGLRGFIVVAPGIAAADNHSVQRAVCNLRFRRRLAPAREAQFRAVLGAAFGRRNDSKKICESDLTYFAFERQNRVDKAMF